MEKQQMIYNLQQHAKNQAKLQELFTNKGEPQRAEIARVKQRMYENFSELLISWLDD